MIKVIERIMVLLLVAIMPVTAVYGGSRDAAAAAKVQDAVAAFARSGCVDSNSVAVLVIDLESRRESGSWQSDKPMVPASVMKAVTTATLLRDVGREWQYETKVYTTGGVRDGVLEGNLLVEASGDPSLNSPAIEENTDFVDEIAKALQELEITTIKGSIEIDESRFEGPAINPDWASGDLPHAYGTGTHGFNFEGNASGGRSVKDPAQVFRNRLTARLKSDGISVEGAETGDSRRKLLLTHKSVAVEEIMRSCMMRSDNQFAEGFMRTISAQAGHDGSVADGTKETLRRWKRKAPAENVIIKDGSGLSRSNRLTADFLGRLLVEMADDPYYVSFFPLAGEEGTIRKFLKDTPLQGRVAMKTGSMRGIQSYAGYKLDDYYAPTHVIVVMINNMSNRAEAREGLRKMLEEIFL